MHFLSKPWTSLILFALSLFTVPSLYAAEAKLSNDNANASIILNAKDLKWAPGPQTLPPGVQVVVLQGNPSKEGFFSMRIKFPANYTVPPHWHTMDERGTVISGTVELGIGDVLDTSKTTPIKANSFVIIPAKTLHWVSFPEETILQVDGFGPRDYHVHSPCCPQPPQ